MRGPGLALEDAKNNPRQAKRIRGLRDIDGVLNVEVIPVYAQHCCVFLGPPRDLHFVRQSTRRAENIV
jgi:hypothetical protein